jgi:hypothetical protein
MALVLKDRVQEVSTTSGTGTLTLTGAVAGFQTFSTAIGNGNTTYYTIFDTVAYVWEVGIGTVGAGTLARTTVLANSSGTTSPLNLAGNSLSVFCTYPAERSINYDADNVATIGSTLGYTDTGIIASFASTVAGYNQVILQNKSTATNASTNFNVSNDAGTSGSNYAELGINSSTFTGSGSFNIAGASYVASASTDLTLGTYGAYSIHFVTNSSTTDAMTIFNNGGISLGGFSNPGIGNMAASKFVSGYSSVTAAAGTTVLTASSNYYQNLVGTTTQTFQLPDATGLLEGTTFIFDNDSTGTLTVVDNASGPIETVPAGAASFVYLADNATVAGTWRRHAFLPASYDFNATTANFGNATITNAVWNGTTIGTAYGGTGLTSFSAANYALYSTNASTLTAGTLPTAAGGTGLTTYTTGDIIYASATNTLSKLAAGTNGYVLTMAAGIPSWAATNAATTRTVNTFTATASQTTFAVSYTVGLIDVYRNGVKLAETDYTATNGTSVVLNTGANAGDTVETVAYSSLSIGTGVTSFSTGTTGLTPTSGSGNVTLAGTLNIANGGTGQTTANSALNALLPSQTSNSGKYLTTDGTNSSWATSVTSFQTSLSGLTPSTATTGAVTLAGTLGVTSGGTGTSTAFTQGSIVFAGASGVYSQNNSGFFWDNANTTMTISGASEGRTDYTSGGNLLLIRMLSSGASQLINNSGSLFQIGANAVGGEVSLISGGTERIRIDASGEVGIGVTPGGTGLLELAQGTSTVAPLEFNAGSLLSTPVAGTFEYASTLSYFTNDLRAGRGYIPSTQIYKLEANGTAIGPGINNFFGANSAINLANGAAYQIEAHCRFLKTTAGTVTVTITTSATPNNISGTVDYGAAAGGNATGAANRISLYNSTSTAAAFGASASLSTGANHTFIIRLFVEVNTCNLRINFTSSAGTVTPLRTSFYKVTKLPDIVATGTYVA